MTAEGVKSIDDVAVGRSVIDVPPPTLNPGFDPSQIFWMVGQYADEMTPWGAGWFARDRQLRQFITKEPIFASALGIICSRNSGFKWTIDGPQRLVNQYQYILETADMGRGWIDLIVRTSIDLYTQDNGAFWEIVRLEDNKNSPFIGLNHLDAARCRHTGNRDYPVVYQDRLGKLHQLPYYSVIELAEMPAPIEGYMGLFGLQYSTLTRLLRKAQTQRNMDTYDYERTAGRNTQAIHMVKGITSQQLQDAINEAKATADGSGLLRFMNPVVVGTLDPKADVGHDTIELMGKPVDYNSEEWFKQYINLISMAFESDYQEFAPLPGGGLGTGAQSEMLHLKSRGKGPGTFMNLITYAINFLCLPKNVQFRFDEQDLEAERGDAQVKAIRAQTRAVRIASGEITPQVARQIANDDGDLALEFVQLMDEQDVTPTVRIESDTTGDSQSQPPVKPGQPAPQVAPQQQQQIPQQASTPAKIPSIRPPTPLSSKQPPGRPHRLKELLDDLTVMLGNNES